MNNIFEAAASMAEPETLIVIDNDDDDDNDNSSSSSGSGDGGRNPARGENNNINNNEETETPDQTPSPPLFTPASQKKARKEGPVAARSSGGHEEGVANEKDQDGPIKYSLVRDSGVGMCSICYCPFDEEEHVMSCLRCGHIFGKPCIIKWLGSKKGNEKVCPICKARAGPSQVMTLYAPQLTEPSVPPDENENRKLRLQLIEAKRQNYLIYQTVTKQNKQAYLSRILFFV